MGLPKSRPRKSKYKTPNERLYEGFKIWTQFYRENPHRFAIEYFGVNLFLFQQILLYMMDKVGAFMFIASRGLGKSYLISVYCCVRAVLYPNSQIIVASATKGQARLLITQKIDKELRLKYPNIAREIKDIKTGANSTVVYFKNGSTIEAVVSNDNARGFRCNILIVDEFRMVKLDVLNKVLRPFLNVMRQPKFYLKKKYKDYPKEENKEIYMSSAWLKAHYSWEKFNGFAESMCKNKPYFVCDLDYKLAINHGLLSEKRAEEMKNEPDMDEITWQLEMLGMFFGGNEKGFFKFEDINPCRNLTRPYYPPTELEYLEYKDSPKNKKKNVLLKLPDEVRIIGYDVSLVQGDENDNSIFTLMRLIPVGNEYIRQVVYIESKNGGHSEDQAIRLKQLFYDFEADYVAMDTNGNGISVYDELVKPSYDKSRDVEYAPFVCFNDEKMKNRGSKCALPVIFSIKASAQFNHEIAMGLKSDLVSNKIKLLLNELEGKEFLMDKLNFAKKNPEEQARLLRPYIQTSIMINETVNLEYELKGTLVRVFETGTNRKDRYSSIAYANYLAKYLEKKNLSKTKSNTGVAYALW
ncbi:terminase family protein [Clostridium perfringens]|nr:terminase family protein [Clostridium perfringens]MDK0982891.1 terminase family protein [Clostridium perfringens]